MAVISTGNHPKLLWPGIQAVWGTTYNKHQPVWRRVFTDTPSDQAYEETVEEVGLGLFNVKPQGGAISYDTSQQGTVSRFNSLTFGLGYAVTMEELQDNLYWRKGSERAQMLARSLYETEEYVHANVLNRAFTSAFAGGDGKELLATDHPTVTGNQSNELTVAADLSEASIEDMCTQIRNMTDSRGLRIMVKPKRIIVPSALHYEAHRVLKSTLQNDTANNAVNVLNMSGEIDEIVTWTYLTDNDAWFIQTDMPNGLTHFTRMKPQFDKDNDFNTKNALASCVARWSNGWSNFRGLTGSPGA